MDVHVHASPDPDAARRLDAHALVRLAQRAGMGGLVLKSHEYPTAPLTWALADEAAPLRLWGGLALDHGVGGLNPEAVRISLSIGAKVVWMPTFDAAQWRAYRPSSQSRSGVPLRVLDDDGSPAPGLPRDPRPDPRARRRARERPSLGRGDDRADGRRALNAASAAS